MPGRAHIHIGSLRPPYYTQPPGACEPLLARAPLSTAQAGQLSAGFGDQAASFVPCTGQVEGTKAPFVAGWRLLLETAPRSPCSLGCACYTTDLRIIQRAGSAGGTELSCLPGPLKLGVGDGANGIGVPLLPRA